MSPTKRNIVIIGGGITGSTTAYFLTRHPSFSPATHTITLLEATSIASGASGKAGGLLALWAYPSAIVPLSFRLHRELAATHNGKDRWGYRSVGCGSIEMAGRVAEKRRKEGGESLGKTSTAAKGRVKTLPKDLDWVHGEGVRSYEAMGEEGATAQVHPYQFTASMAALAEEAGVKVVLGRVTGINQGKDKSVESVTYTAKDDGSENTIEADTVVLAAGPWTPRVWPAIPISAMRAHSVTIRPTREVSAYALFTSISMPKGGGGRAKTVTPEIYARPNNEVYACGDGDSLVPLPETSDLVEIDQSRCQDIVDQVGAISRELAEGEVLVRQACYLPNVSGGGGPLIGESGVKGLLIATGHTCWGIQNAPATGKLISEFVWEGKATSANISALDPRKYM